MQHHEWIAGRWKEEILINKEWVRVKKHKASGYSSSINKRLSYTRHKLKIHVKALVLCDCCRERARSGHSNAYRSSACQRSIRLICYRSFILVHVVHMKGNNKIHLWVLLKIPAAFKMLFVFNFFLFIYSDRVGFHIWQLHIPSFLYLWPIFYFSCFFLWIF